MSVFNTNVFDHTKQYMFFGEELGVSRLDTMRYPKFDKLVEQGHGYFWRPSEIDLSKDRIDFQQKMSAVEQRIFTSNLQYQTLLDSVQGRSPVEVLLPICSLPELEAWIETWAFQETIHSRSYTHIIRNVYNNPSEVFDQINIVPEILERAKMVTEAYDELEHLVYKYKLGLVDKSEMYLPLFKCMVSVYALEAIRFYVSFACSYAFNERGLMEGNCKIIKLINREEFLHQGGTHFILTRWLKNLDDPAMHKVAKDNMHLIPQILKETAEQEKAWGRWLFKDGGMLGLNEKIINAWVEYLTDKSLAELGQETIYGVSQNPLPWMDSYMFSDDVQISPQETELSSYIVGGLDSNLDDFGSDLDF